MSCHFEELYLKETLSRSTLDGTAFMWYEGSIKRMLNDCISDKKALDMNGVISLSCDPK